MEEDRFSPVLSSDRQATLAGETKQFRRGKSAKQVVSPGGECRAGGVDIVAGGQIEGFDEDSFDVPAEAFRARLELRPE